MDDAVKTIGVRSPQVIFRHHLPNAITLAIVLVARDIDAIVILGVAFVFIGIGGESPWGMLVTASRDYVIGPFGNPLPVWWVFWGTA